MAKQQKIVLIIAIDELSLQVPNGKKTEKGYRMQDTHGILTLI